MAPPTFTVEFPQVASLPLQDGLFGILNNANGYGVEIRKVDARMAGAYGNNDIAKLQWSRITALSGGMVVPASKYDSTAAALPSQVIARRYDSDINATVTDLFRQWAEVPGALGIECPGFSTTPMVARLGGKNNATGATSWYAGQPGGGTRAETIILREGEGIALQPSQGGIPHSMWVSMSIRVVGTAHCYEYSDALLASMSPEQYAGILFALFNGSGSGVVLEVRVARVSPMSAMDTGFQVGTTPVPNMRLALIDGWLTQPDITSYVPSAHNTQSPIPSGITFASGFTGLPRGWNDGHLVEWPFYHGGWIDEPTNSNGAAPLRYEQSIGRVRQHSQANMYAQSGISGLIVPWSESIWDCRGGDGILLRPGQGFAGLAGGSFTNGGFVVDNYALSQWVFRVTFAIKQIGAELAGTGGTYVS